MAEAVIDNFMKQLKAEGRSSPAGQHWAKFHEMLCHHSQRIGAGRPPVPLILAASGESDAAKHRRLAEQLYWAETNGVVSEALEFLRGLPEDHWNSNSVEKWNATSYWEPGE
jgi:hypothetical protein